MNASVIQIAGLLISSLLYEKLKEIFSSVIQFLSQTIESFERNNYVVQALTDILPAFSKPSLQEEDILPFSINFRQSISSAFPKSSKILTNFIHGSSVLGISGFQIFIGFQIEMISNITAAASVTSNFISKAAEVPDNPVSQ
jgi:hypothetical protein